MGLVSRLLNAARSVPFACDLTGKHGLICQTRRPPNYETETGHLGSAVTANQLFFVRYHLPDIPEIDGSRWRLEVNGAVNREISLGLDELKRLPAHEITAVCECSGNQRRMMTPLPPGVPWGQGAVGCARWRGTRLKDVLERTGLAPGVIEIAFEGGDEDPSGELPPYVKSIPVAKALEDTALIAYEMNGEPLPHWNGFPARLVIPGWTATYWVKQLRSITARTAPCESYWMRHDYRVPLGKFPGERFRSQENGNDTAITTMLVDSLITSHEDGAKIPAGESVSISGVAWDGGCGIASVEYSLDEANTWHAAELGTDFGRFAFRPFQFSEKLSRGKHVLLVRARNHNDETQPFEPTPNPCGYHYNAIQKLSLVAR